LSIFRIYIGVVDMESVGSRAHNFIGASAFNSYIGIHVSFLNDLYDPHSNPDGAILMSVAENKLCADMILSKITEHNSYPQEVLNYTDPTGSPALKGALVNFLSNNVFHGGPGCIGPEHLIASAGCTSLLIQLGVMLFEPNDSVLVPTPYYPAFDRDFRDLGQVHTWPIDPCNDDFGLTLEDLECAYSTALAEGHPPKALLLTNPHNPLGKIYPPAELMMAVQWCRNKRIHLICDEIYAMSIFDTSIEGQTFHSLASLLHHELGDYVHLLWGVSKDLGASGLRMGVLYSQNETLLAALGTNNMGHQVSHVTQEILAGILCDNTFMGQFIATNACRIKQSYQLLTEKLTELAIPYYHAGAGIFLFVDLSSLLSEESFEAETELHKELAQSVKLSFTPGGACHHARPGHFRFCFCWVTTEAVRECNRRLEKFIRERKLLANAN